MKLYTAIGKYEFRVSGHGVTGVNALHNLLTRSAAFLHLNLMKHVPLQVTRKILEKPQFNETEKQLSEGEPVKCVEYGITDVSTNHKLVDAQYDGLFLACNASLKHQAVARSNISSPAASGEVLVNVYRGTGRVLLAPAGKGIV